MNLKSAGLSVGYQVIPSLMALWFFYNVPKENSPAEVYIAFYIVGAIGLVKFISDFGLSRSFLKIYANSDFNDRILSAFIKLYFVISVVVLIVSSLLVLNINYSYFLIPIALCIISFSMFLDNYLVSKDKMHLLYLIDSLFFSFFYGAAIILLDQNSPEFLIMAFFVFVLVKTFYKYYFSKLSLMRLIKTPFSLEVEEKNEFKYSLMSSFSIAGYKQTDRAIIMYFFSPVLYSLWQVSSQVVNKLMLFPQLVAKQMLVKFSTKKDENKKNISSFLYPVYVITEIYNLVFLVLILALSDTFLGYLGFKEKYAIDALIWIGLIAIYATSTRYIRAYIIGCYGGRSLVGIDLKAGAVSLLIGIFLLSLSLPVHFYILAGVVYYLYIYMMSWFYLLKKTVVKSSDILIVFVFELFKVILIIFGDFQ
jgi:O-antigen/teichoic acid export membrane protein